MIHELYVNCVEAPSINMLDSKIHRIIAETDRETERLNKEVSLPCEYDYDVDVKYQTTVMPAGHKYYHRTDEDEYNPHHCQNDDKDYTEYNEYKAGDDLAIPDCSIMDMPIQYTAVVKTKIFTI